MVITLLFTQLENCIYNRKRIPTVAAVVARIMLAVQYCSLLNVVVCS